MPVDTGAVAVVDGGNGLGMLAGKFAMDLATQRARDFGIGMVLIRNTNTCLLYTSSQGKHLVNR